MSFLLHRTSKHNSYILQSKLRGHLGGIVRLRAMEDGRLLASGGTDGTKIWDLTTMRELGSPKSPETRGASTALVWIKREDNLGKALFYGTQNGQLGLAVFEEISCVRIVNPAEITGSAPDPPPQLPRSPPLRRHEVFSLELQNVAPRAIGFGQMYFNDRDIMVFGLYGGDMRWASHGTLGHSYVRKGVLIMDEPLSGTNLYRLEDHTRMKTFPVAVTKQKRLRQVDFLEECQFIVSGSDHGIVYVFDRHSGDIVDELRVDPREWVQTIAVSDSLRMHVLLNKEFQAADCAGVSTIFAARSRDLVGSNKIFVWRKKSKKRFGVVGIACVLSGLGRLRRSYCDDGDDRDHRHITITKSLSTTADVVHRQGQTPSLTHAEALAELQPALIPVGAHCTPSLAHAGALAELRPAPIPVGALYMTSHQPPTHLYHGFCHRCDICPTCGSSPSTAHTATSATAPPAPASVHGSVPATSYTPPGGSQAPVVPMNDSSSERRYFRYLSSLKKLSDVVRRQIQLGVTDDGPIDHLANVFTGLVVTDNGPDVRGQQHSKLFSSHDDFQDSLPSVPLGFQPLSPSEAIQNAPDVPVPSASIILKRNSRGPDHRNVWVTETGII
ncbi:hypothetical protein B0H14DRAFT_2631674 [Mycena olivaceomarginata]|nr:hypothetical protein B0H14DRAFT_2631674 [Mycena olivaceomarginata]